MSKLGKKMIAAVEEGVEKARNAKEVCPACGLNLALIGRPHNCRPKAQVTTNTPTVSLTPVSVVSLIPDLTVSLTDDISLREQIKSSLGGGESRPTGPSAERKRQRLVGNKGVSTPQGETCNTLVREVPLIAGVAPNPSEKKKRVPADSFDRKAYQREYMRKRRAKV